MSTIQVPDYISEPSPAVASASGGMSALHNIPKHHELHGHIRQIYYDFKHLGYFDQYGSSCFAMAALTARILRAKGYDTEVRGCHAIFRNSNKEFYLGYQGYAQPGQIEGHVVCVVGGNIVLDFGLGNVRKHHNRYFYRAVACVASNSGPVLASLDFGNGVNVQWRTDWVGPEIEGELIKQEPYLLPILAKYDSYKQNRLGYLVRNIFRGSSSRATLI